MTTLDTFWSDLGWALVAGWALMIPVMALLWIYQHRRDDASVVDVGWTLGTGAVAVVFALLAEGSLERRAALAGLTLLWSLRLGIHILRRLGGREDPRYRKLREHWGKQASAKFFFFFQAQAILAPLLAVPFFVAMTRPAVDLTAWEFVGIAILMIALVGEGLADQQLAAWKRDPNNKGKTCRRGLWRYSRHPNYFFEWLHWVSYVIIAAGHPYWWLTLPSPIIMYLLLTRGTGIPFAEQQSLRSRGDDYRRYQAETNAFFPGPPRTAEPESMRTSS